MGVVPESSKYNGKRYSPKTFAQKPMNSKLMIMSISPHFTHQLLNHVSRTVPDNFSNGSYYNLPLNEMIDLVKTAVNNGFTGDVGCDKSNQ